eukprot:scaffold7091_cov273-Chaetoceros_neogracile.AAC.21
MKKNEKTFISSSIDQFIRQHQKLKEKVMIKFDNCNLYLEYDCSANLLDFSHSVPGIPFPGSSPGIASML